MVTMKAIILVEVTMVVVGTMMTLEIIVVNSHQIMDPWKGAVWVEEAQAVPVAVSMDLVLEAVHMIADGFQKAAEKGCGSK